MTLIQKQHVLVNEVQLEVILHLQCELIESSPNDEVIAQRRSSIICRPVILDDYIIYLIDSDFNIGLPEDSITFSQSTSKDNLHFDWMEWEMS